MTLPVPAPAARAERQLSACPAASACHFGSDDEDDDAPAKPPPKEDLSKTGAFMLSQSGAFKVSDFQIRPEGGLMSTIDEAADISDHAHPAELSASSTDLALQAHALEADLARRPRDAQRAR